MNTVPRAYLDTVIVSGIVKSDLKPAEIEAVRRLLLADACGQINLVTSQAARDELDRIPLDYRAEHLEIYDLLEKVDLVPLHSSRSSFLPTNFLESPWYEDPLFTELQRSLPDWGDAVHAFEAAQNNCAYLITVDGATFLKHRERVMAVSGLCLVTPSEFESSVL